MTISSTNRKAGPYVGNGSSTVFPFSFKIFSASDLYVTRTNALGVATTLTKDVDFIPTLNANQDASPGGSIALTAALAVGYTLDITSDISPTQLLDLTNQGGFYPQVITKALDKITILIQQLITNGITSGSIGGEANTSSNLGTGYGLAAAKSGVNLPFKSLKAGTGVTMSATADEITIHAPGSGGGGTWDGFANIVDFGAVADFVPAAGGLGAGTSNDTAVMAAIATGKPLYIPDGNFYVANWATRYAISRASVIGPGKFWGDTGSGKMELGKSVIVGSTNTHEVSYAGGVLWANAGASGMRTWTGQHNWMITQPDKGPCQVQLYPGCQALAARSISPNILEATYGTYDLTNLYVGDHIGWNGEVWKVASILSTTQITVTTFAGGAPGFVTSAQSYPWYRAYEVGEGLCNTSGTSVVRVSGDAWPAGYSGDHMYAIINGTRYSVSQGPENAGNNKLVLSASAGVQSNVSIRFFRTYGPWSYVTLFRFQGIAGGTETNGGMALNIKNEFCIWNGGTHNAMYGPLRLNAPKVTIGPGTYGNERIYDRLEVDDAGVCLGGNSYGTPIYNYMKVLGGGTGFAPALAGRGIDANPDFGFDLKGNGTFRFTAGSFGRNVTEIYAPAGTNTWPTLAAGVAEATFSVNSSLTNADLTLAPKGSGIVKIASNPWLYFSFQNGWTDATWGVPTGFRLDPGGRIVRFRGMISGGSNGTIIGYLPTGLRPPNTVFLTGVGNGLTPAGLQIFSDGRVYGFGSGSPVDQITLDGMTFHLD